MLMEITLDYNCNCNCIFCSVGDKRKDLALTTQEVKLKIIEANENNFNVLGFGGGEPTLRKDLFEILKFAKEFNFDIIRIQSNGLMFAYEEYTKKIIKAGVNFFKLSIHGHNAALHDMQTQVKGSFNKAIEGIKNIRKHGMSVEINTVINKHNYKFLPQITDYFINLGVTKFCFIYPTYNGNALANFKNIGISMTECAPYLIESMDMINELGLDKSLPFNIPQCIFEKFDSKYSYSGKFNTIVSTPENTEDIDISSKQAKHHIKKCEACTHKTSCDGIWEKYLELFGEKEFL